MKTNNAKRSNWLRRVSALMAVLMLTLSFQGQASARILFQDDNFSDDVSEGLRLNSDDGGDEDVTLQFGNDGTDGTVIWDDGTSTLTVGDGTDNVAVDSATWDVSAAGVGSGFTGFTSTGAVNFSGSSQFRIREDSDPASNAACSSVGELIFDTTDNQIQRCAATGGAGAATWTNIDTTGGSSDFEAVYGNDAGKDLLVTDNTAAAFTIGEGANDYIRIDTTNGAEAVEIDQTITAISGATISGATTNVNASSNFATNINTGTSTGAVSIGGGSGTVAINSTSWDVSTAGVGSGFTGFTSTGAIDFSGASSFLMHQGSSNPGTCTEGQLFYNTTDNITYACTATNTFTAIGAGGDAGTLDGLDSADFLRASASDVFGSGAGSETLTIGDGTNADGVAFAANSTINFTNATVSGLDATEVDYDGTTVDAGLGNRSFTEDNVVTDDASFTANVDALDQKWGDLASTANGEGASLVGIEDATGYYTGTDLESVLDEIGGQIGSNAVNVDEMTFEPEYPNSVVFSDGSNNKGKLEATYDDTNRENYYRWTSQQATDQDIDIRFRYELPADFVDAGNLTARFRTNSTSTAVNSVQVIVRNDTDNTTCHTDAAAASSVADTWETITVTGAEIDTGCSAGALLAAGDIIEIQLKLLADNGSTGADVGTIEFAYTN